MSNLWYVYRHRRLDDNSIFYIGVGKTDNYKRAYDKIRRSLWWKYIVTITPYEVEIVQINLSKEDAEELEIFLISLYGRKDLGKGSLVNMTDGGDGMSGYKPTQETILKRTGKNNGFFGKHHSKETIEKRVKHDFSKENNPMFGKKGLQCPKTKIIINLESGIFHYGILDAAEAYNLKYQNLKAYLNGKAKNKTNLIYI